MVYIPGALVTRLMLPLTELIEAPAGEEEYVPPAVPENVTDAVPIFEQKGLPG